MVCQDLLCVSVNIFYYYLQFFPFLGNLYLQSLGYITVNEILDELKLLLFKGANGSLNFFVPNSPFSFTDLLRVPSKLLVPSAYHSVHTPIANPSSISPSILFCPSAYHSVQGPDKIPLSPLASCFELLFA